MTFGPFRRFRLRSAPIPDPTRPDTEDDTDESSPERDKPRVLHIVTSRSSRKSADHLLAVPDVAKLSHDGSENSTDSTDLVPSLDKVPQPRPQPSPNKHKRSGPIQTVTCPIDTSLHPLSKPTLMRRVTSKLKLSLPSKSGQTLPPRQSAQTLPDHVESQTRNRHSPRSKTALAPPLPNALISKGQREAALRERGLLPPCKDLSEQEREADARLRSFSTPTRASSDGLSEAERLRASWFAMNRDPRRHDSEWRPPMPPYLQETRSRAYSTGASSSSSIADSSRRSGEGSMDLGPIGRLSTCSTCPPLSTASNLEVLLEEPSELSSVPPLSPTNLRITVSDNDSPPRAFIESPVSCTFSSHPGSTPDSPVLEKENTLPRTLRRSSERSRRPVGSSLSKAGSRSLSNLRRSIAGSIRLHSSSSLSTADVPPTPTSSHLATIQGPRTAVSPTIHSPASILWETKDIKDVESRRLSELAFLD